MKKTISEETEFAKRTTQMVMVIETFCHTKEICEFLWPWIMWLWHLAQHLM